MKGIHIMLKDERHILVTGISYWAVSSEGGKGSWECAGFGGLVVLVTRRSCLFS